MMGSAASALATFLGHTVNISPPEILDVENPGSIRDMFALKGEELVSIKFNLNIEGLVDSEFISALEPDLAREIVAMSLGANNMELAMKEPLTKPIKSEPARMDARPEKQEQLQRQEKASGKQEEAQEYTYKELESAVDLGNSESAANNMDLVMSVPILLTVELGRTRKKIRDIIELAQGNIIELDRQAGAPVDIMANGRLIAKGDVVVVDDNYSVRITEIVRSKGAITEV